MDLRRSFLGVALVTLPALAVAAWPGAARAQLAPGEPTEQLVLTNFAGPFPGLTDVAFLSDGRAVAITKTGLIVVLKPDGTVLKMPAYTFPYLDADSEKGLLGVVRDDSDALYFYASSGLDGVNKHHVHKGKIAADGTITLEAQTIDGGGLEGPANHDGGGLIIHKNQLYIGVGDTGLNSTPPFNKYGACLNKANGKILRINLDGSVPTDNPLANVALATGCTRDTIAYGVYAPAPPDRRVYAWGLRNPWRLWIDPETDLLWIGDVGEATQEEISVGPGGSNFGWPFIEGTMVYPAVVGGLKTCEDVVPKTATCVPPQYTYARATGTGASVTGGLIPPRGCGWGAFEKRYFFGDYSRNLVWTLDVAADRRSAVVGSVKPAIDLPAPVSFRMGPDGALYIASAQGLLKRLAPKNIPATCNAKPAPDAGADAAADAADALADVNSEVGSETGAAGDGPREGDARADVASDARDAGDAPRADAASASDDDGCSCTLGRGRSGHAGSALLLGLLALGLGLRRRSAPRSSMR